MTAIQLTTLSQIRKDIALRQPHSRRLVGIDFILRLQKNAALRQEVDFVSEFEVLLNEEMRDAL